MGLSTVVVQGGISTGALVVGGLGAVIGIGGAMSACGGLYSLAAAGALARVESLREAAAQPRAKVGSASA
jgi:hypothetical protein